MRDRKQLRSWFRRAFIICALVVFGVPLGFGLLLMLTVKLENQKRYDRDDPTYKYVTQRIEAGGKIELARINGGDWQVVCFIGAYNDPAEVLLEQAGKRKIKISKIDSVNKQFLGISPVEETEGAISFVDGSGHGRTILIDGFERLTAQHGRPCFGRDTKEITLPILGQD
jgi:hypothetical protein